MSRPLFFLLGWGFFALGALGVFLPVLPTTPFMLLALWAFARSSERFHQWLYHHRLFGPPLQRWEEYRVIPRGAKVFALSMMAVSLFYVMLFVAVFSAVKLFVVLLMAYGAWFILSKPSEPPGGNS